MSKKGFKPSACIFLKQPTVYITLSIYFIFMSTFATVDISSADIDKRIYITSDTLVSGKGGAYAEFSGNVKAVQGGSVITSDILKIFFKKNPVTKDNTGADEETINKIVAEGNVNITFDNRVAVTDKAVYTVADRIFVLTGENSTITTEGNSISGKKITIYRDTGRISFERGESGPVKAVIQAGDKGID